MPTPPLAHRQRNSTQSIKNVKTAGNLGFMTKGILIAGKGLTCQTLKLSVPQILHGILRHAKDLGAKEEVIKSRFPMQQHTATPPVLISRIQMLLVQTVPACMMSAPFTGQPVHIRHETPKYLPDKQKTRLAHKSFIKM